MWRTVALLGFKEHKGYEQGNAHRYMPADKILDNAVNFNNLSVDKKNN